jgi:predicted permease
MRLSEIVRFGQRTFRRAPVANAAAVLVIAIGIGLVTTMFSIVRGALYRGLPVERPDQIVRVDLTDPRTGEDGLLVPASTYLAWKDRQRVFQGLAGVRNTSAFVSRSGEASALVEAANITPDLLSVLAVRPVIGRGFHPDDAEPGAAPVVLIGDKIWREMFRGDSAALNATLQVNGRTATVVGIMPATFGFPINAGLWTPLSIDPARAAGPGAPSLTVVGRLKDGTSPTRAEIDLRTLTGQIARDSVRGVLVKPYIQRVMGRQFVALGSTMLASVFAVLLIACVNVTNLLLAIASARSKEIAVRRAIGATRVQIMVQVLAETMILTILGAIGGVLFAEWGVDLFRGVLARTSGIPFWVDVRLDATALLLAFALAIAAAIASGLAPAFRASEIEPGEALKAGSRGASTKQGGLIRALVISEVALTCGLLVPAMLLIRTVANVDAVGDRFGEEYVLTATLAVPPEQYSQDSSRARLFATLGHRLNEALGAHATLASDLPGLVTGGMRVAIDGDPRPLRGDYPIVAKSVVDPGFFETFRIPLLSGRSFGPGDTLGGRRVVIVNASFAHRWFPRRSPLGARLRLGSIDTDSSTYEIIGVTADRWMNRRRARSGVLSLDASGIYVPLLQSPPQVVRIALRSSDNALVNGPALRKELASVAPQSALLEMQTLAAAVDDENAFYRIFGALFSIFGVVALTLAAVGLYGVAAFWTSRRTREIGIRLALGARPREVLRLVFAEGGKQVGIGIAVSIPRQSRGL